MKVIVTTITRSPKGNPIRASREISAEQIRIGRGAECELRLADPRVPLQARTIFLGKSGPQLYEAFDANVDATFNTLSGVHRPQALKPGTSLRIGPYLLEVAAPHHDADLALTVELVQPLPGQSTLSAQELYDQARRSPLSKRALSWALFIGVLAFFLLLPALQPAGRHAAAATPNAHLSGSAASLAGVAQASWNPGELAAGHQPFAKDCRLCHSASFQRVQDKDCLACHRNLGDHVKKTTGPVAGLSEVRCASCHHDHNGRAALRAQMDHFFMGECSACHRDIKAHLPGSHTQNVTDFATLHPQFRATLVTGSTPAGQPEIARIRLSDTDRLLEQRGLKFPHDVHLDPRGVKGPQGRVQMTCGSCHVPDSSGRHFQPVTMAQHCQSCHELRFEPAMPDRQVPHGNVDEVMQTLRDFYSRLALDGVTLNRPPAATGDASVAGGIPGRHDSPPLRLNGPAAVEQQVQRSATEIFEKTTCFSCHEISRITGADGTPSWQVAKVLPAPQDWMPGAHFSHAAHAMADCGSCHAAAQSKKAQDVLMPGIASCRNCHAGQQAEPQKIVSHCGMCHGFHNIAHPARLPPRDAPWPSAQDAALLHSLPASLQATRK